MTSDEAREAYHLPAGTYGRLDAEISPGRHLILFVPEPMTDRETAACIRELADMTGTLAESLLPEREAEPNAEPRPPSPGQIFSLIMDDPERRNLFMQKFEGDATLRPLVVAFRDACKLFEQPNIRESAAAIFAEFGFRPPAAHNQVEGSPTAKEARSR